MPADVAVGYRWLVEVRGRSAPQAHVVYGCTASLGLGFVAHPDGSTLAPVTAALVRDLVTGRRARTGWKPEGFPQP